MTNSEPTEELQQDQLHLHPAAAKMIQADLKLLNPKIWDPRSNQPSLYLIKHNPSWINSILNVLKCHTAEELNYQLFSGLYSNSKSLLWMCILLDIIQMQSLNVYLHFILHSNV